MLIFAALFSLPLFARDLMVYTSFTMDSETEVGNSEIFMMDLAKKKPIRLTNNKSTEFSPTLHPHGNLVAYITDRYKDDIYGDNQVMLRNLATGTEERLDIGTQQWAINPAFSADGKYLYLSRGDAPQINTPSKTYKIVRFDLATKEFVEILRSDPGNFFDLAPSPDGKNLAYRYASDGDQHVRVLNLTTMESKPLNPQRPDKLDEARPAWKSPNELSIVTAYGEHEWLQKTLFRVDLSGKAEQILRTPLIYDYQSACWINAHRGVLAASDTKTNSLQLFLVEGEKLQKISGPEVWWSGEPDCKTVK